MLDLGTVRPGTTLYIPFNTFSSDDPSASMTITGLATTDIEVYKDGGTTQRASDAGYALLDTDGIDFDTITGIHGISIDLADNTTAGFYAAGSQYWVVLSSITLDAATINFVAATFRIGYPEALINTTIATLASQTSFTLTSGPAEDDALNGMMCVIHDVASAVQLGYAVISDYTGSTKTVTLAAGTTFTAAATDNIAILGPMPLQPTTLGRTLDVETGGCAGIDWGNVANPTTAVDLSATDIQLCDTITTYTGNTVQTGDSFARLGAPAGASVSADIATVDGNVDAILVDTAEIGAAGAGLSAVPWNAAWDAEVQSEVNDGLVALGLDHLVGAAVVGTDITDNSIIAKMVSKSATADWDSFDNTTDALEALRDRGDAAWTTGAGGSDRLLMVDTTIATLATQTSFTLTAGSSDDDAYNNCTIVVEDASTSTQKAVGMVLDYTGATKTVTLKEALAFTIATTDKVYILAENALKSTVANRQLDVTATGAAGIDWGNVENPTTAVDLSATDIQLCDTITTYTGNTVQTGDAFARLGAPAGASVSADVAAVKAETTLIVADTNELQTDWTNGGRLDLIVDAILVDTAEIGAAGAGLTNINLPNQTMDITGNLSGSVGSVTGAVGSVTGNVGGNVTGSIGSLGATAKSDVNAEVVDALATDTYAEPGQGAPAATATLAAKINYLYKAWRNKSTQTATEYKLFDDAGTTVDQKATVSDDGTTATKGEVGTGP